MRVISEERYAYGLDISMSTSGIAIFNMDTLKPVLVTSITTNDKSEHGHRLNEQRCYMKTIATEYKPTVIFIEKGFTRHNTATQVIFRTVGVYNELLRNFPQEYLAPSTVKKAITGNGRASKELLQEVLTERYPEINFSNEDESDAVGVVLCGLIQQYGMKWELPTQDDKGAKKKG